MSYRIGWFSTGRDQAARDLLTAVHQAIQEGTINGEIAFVFSNRERGENQQSDKFFDLVAQYGIDLVCFSSKNYKPQLRRRRVEQWRIEYDREAIRRLVKYETDLNVLAGYMLIVGDEMCRKYDMINLHPAVPGGPKGTWQEVIWQLIKSRAEATGVMMHLVTEVLDEGPPIAYCTFPIRGGTFDKLWKDLERKLQDKSLAQIQEEGGENNPLFSEIRSRGVIRELPLLVHTIKEFADGRIKIENKKLIVEGKPYKGGYDLTKEIETRIDTNEHKS